jgi:hypothetical protein
VEGGEPRRVTVTVYMCLWMENVLDISNRLFSAIMYIFVNKVNEKPHRCCSNENDAKV